ncbi:MAG: prephenate dehydratase domain-containing protein, partial [Bacteroidales bacterium]
MTKENHYKGQLRVAIQGGYGAFHEIAARKYYKNIDLEIIPCDTFIDLFESIATKKADSAVVAIENSVAGSLIPNYALLSRYDQKVTGEVYIRIVQNLIGLPGDKIEDIKEVHSHPMAILQCQDFLEPLRKRGVKVIESIDTALSAKWISEKGKKGVAALASYLAADMYGLELIAEVREISDPLAPRPMPTRCFRTSPGCSYGWPHAKNKQHDTYRGTTMLVKSERERKLLIITVAILMVGVGFVAYGRYEAVVGTMANQWESSQQRYDAKYERIRTLDPAEVKKRHQQITQELRIPGGDALARIKIRDELDAYLTNAGITQRWTTTPLDINENRELGIQKFRFRVDNLQASMPVFARFLNFVTQDSSLMEVEEMTIRSVGRLGNSDELRITMTVSRIVFTDQFGK